VATFRCADVCCLLQITQPQLNQLLWCSCRSAMQQLLQPLQVQLQGLPSTSYPGSSSSSKGDQQQQQHVRLPSGLSAALGGVQQQLQLVAGGASSSGGSVLLLLQLLQLAAVVIPASAPANEAAAAAGAVCTHEFAWILQDQQQQQQHSAGSVAGSPRATEAPQQQQQKFLVFQAAVNAQVLHVLPLQLAVSVLQLLQGLAQNDDSSLGTLAAGLGASHVPCSYQQLCMRHNNSSSNSSRHGWLSGSSRGYSGMWGPGSSSVPAAVSAGAGSSAAAAAGATGEGHGAPGQPRFGRFSSSSSRAAAGSTVACWGPAESALQAALSASSSNCAAAGAHPSPAAAAAAQGSSMPRPKHSSLLYLLADVSACHPSLLLQVGGLLAVLAERLPMKLRQLLLVPPISDKVLLQLLHGEGYAVRCQAAAVLQALLVCPAVAAALTAAALPEPAEEPDSAAAAAAAADVVTADVGGPGAPPQPSNRGLGASTRSTSKAATGKATAAAAAAAAIGKFSEAVDHQRPSNGSNQQAAPAAAAAVVAPRIANQSVYDLLFGLLDCLSVSLNEAPAVDASSSGSSSSGSSSSGSSSSSSVVCGQGRWGRYELQRRSCGIVAQLLHNRQVALLQLLLDGAFTAGTGDAGCVFVTVATLK
jgi:hypothetical protein